MGLFEELEKRQAMNPKERIISSLKNRREKKESWIKILQIHVIAEDVKKNNLNPRDLDEATKEEKEELNAILEKWKKT
jgi:hypothetical protein